MFSCGPLARWVLNSLHALQPFCAPLSGETQGHREIQSCLLNVEEGSYSAVDTAVPLWKLSSMWGLWLPSPSLCQFRATGDQQELLSLSNAISSWKANVCAMLTSKYTILRFGCGSVLLALSSFVMSHWLLWPAILIFFSAVLLFAPWFQNEAHK